MRPRLRWHRPRPKGPPDRTVCSPAKRRGWWHCKRPQHLAQRSPAKQRRRRQRKAQPHRPQRCPAEQRYQRRRKPQPHLAQRSPAKQRQLRRRKPQPHRRRCCRRSNANGGTTPARNVFRSAHRRSMDDDAATSRRARTDAAAITAGAFTLRYPAVARRRPATRGAPPCPAAAATAANRQCGKPKTTTPPPPHINSASNVVRFPGVAIPPPASLIREQSADEPPEATQPGTPRAPLRGFTPTEFEFHAPAASAVELPGFDLLERASDDSRTRFRRTPRRDRPVDRAAPAGIRSSR